MTQSREDMLNELCHLTWRRNELQWRRQRARSKVGYYSRILRMKDYIKQANRDNREVFAHWLDAVPKKYASSTKGELQIYIKKHLAEQLDAESNIHEFTFRTTKRVKFLLKELGYRQYRPGTNRVHALVPRDSHKAEGCDCHPAIYEKEINQRSDDYITECILLRNREP